MSETTKNILLVLLNQRKDSSVKVQEVLTKYGCIIQTRLGLHNSPKNSCSSHGMIVLELADGDIANNQNLAKDLAKIDGVKTQLVSMDF